MPSFFDAPKKTLRQLFGQRRKDTVGNVAGRFLQAFEDHGVEASQIPRLLPQIKLDDLQSPAKLLAALTPKILDMTAQLFGIRSQWLEGVGDEIYDGLWTYKQPSRLLEHLASLCATDEQRFWHPLRVLTTTRKLDRNDPGPQLLAPILIEKIAELGEDDIYRYHIYREGFDWGYQPTRIELKVMARLVYQKFGAGVPLYEVTPKQMDDILESRAIPRRYLRGSLLTTPSLEDFALSNEESRIAKEVEELPDVLRYLEDSHLQTFSFVRTTGPATVQEAEPATSPDSSDPAEAQELQRKPGKRQVQAGHWEAIRAAAKAFWALDHQLSIADMILRLKRIPVLKASALSDSAIRKHIRDLAPDGIRGKAGRKPKQSV